MDEGKRERLFFTDQKVEDDLVVRTERLLTLWCFPCVWLQRYIEPESIRSK